MGAVISIDSYSAKAGVGQIPIPSVQVMGLAHGCTRLLERIGALAQWVEVIKIASIHTDPERISFLVKIIFNWGRMEKIESHWNFDLRLWTDDERQDWQKISNVLVCDGEKHLYRDLEIRANEHEQRGAQLLKLVPEDRRL